MRVTAIVSMEFLEAWYEMDRKLNFTQQKRTWYALAVLLLVAIFLTTQWSSINNGTLDIRSRIYLHGFGWNVTHLSGPGYESVTKEQHLENKSLLNLQFQAAERMGFQPRSAIGRPVKVYEYGLTQVGLNRPLRAEIWWQGGSVVCATITHAEPNLEKRFWAPNERLEDILVELQALKIKAVNEGRVHP